MPLDSTNFAILEGYPHESGGIGGSEATVAYVGPAHERFDFLKEVFGYVDVTGWVPPITYPNPLGATMRPISWKADIYDGESPVRLNGSPITSALHSISSDCLVKIEITFSNKRENSGGGGTDTIAKPDGTFLEIHRASKVEVIEIPGRFTRWDTGSYESAVNGAGGGNLWTGGPQPRILREDQLSGVTFVSRNITVSWNNVPYPNFNHIDQMYGRVNVEPWLGWPRWAVMFVGHDLTATADVAGTVVYNVEYEFLVATKFWDPDPAVHGPHPMGVGSVTNKMIGMIGRSYEPISNHFIHVLSYDEFEINLHATAADFNNLFQYAP